MDEEFSNVLEELADHPGQHLVWQRDSLQRALQIFFRHTDSLVEFLDDVRQQPSTTGDRSVADEYNDEFVVKSHDYFSAAYGLFSKAQNFQSRWYCDCDSERCRPGRCEKFEPYFETLRESGLAERGNYINSIRVMTQKIQTPSLLTQTEYNFFGLKPETGVVINRQELLDWVKHDNRKPAVEYLEEREGLYLDLRAEVRQYSECVEEFYGWLFADVEEEYAHLLRDRRQIITEHA